MKKLFLFLLVVVSFSACTTEEYYSNVKPYTKKFLVKNNMWEEASDATGNYLYCTFDLPKLDDYVFNNGVLEAYLYYKPKGLKESVLSPLPFSDFIVDDEGYKYEEHFTVEFGYKTVTFILKPDDHNIDYDPFYSEYEFVVRLLWDGQ